jgi:hypothetical protein
MGVRLAASSVWTILHRHGIATIPTPLDYNGETFSGGSSTSTDS